LESFACLAARQGAAETAAQLFGAVEVHLAHAAARFDPNWHLEHDELIANARTQLGEATFAALWAAGAAMTLDEAVTLVGTI
jgi:hypothetical protein